MSELSEIKDMLRLHVKESKEWMGKVDGFINKTEVHHGYTQETVKSHGAAIKTLQTNQDKQSGALWIMGAIAAFLGFMSKLFIDIFKH